MVPWIGFRIQAIEMRPSRVKRAQERMDSTPAHEELDLTGLKCPLPSLMTARALRRLPSGTLLAVTVTDALAPLDIRFLCEREGHEFIEQSNADDAVRLMLRRK